MIYDAPKLITVYAVKSSVLGLQQAPENSELAPSVLNLYGLLLHSITLIGFSHCYQYSGKSRLMEQQAMAKDKPNYPNIRFLATQLNVWTIEIVPR